MKDMVLDVMIATHGPQGLEKVAEMNLKPIEGVRYLVSCQSAPMPTPEELLRDDIEIHFTDSKGLSANRNNLLRLASAPYALVADNDLEYLPGALEEIVGVMEQNPEVDLATFINVTAKKAYPTGIHDISQKHKNYYVSSVEILLRMDSIRREKLEFCELMSTGTKFLQAEEEGVFLLNALRRGLKCVFFPIKLCIHKGEFTLAANPTRPGILRAGGAMIALQYPWTSPLRLPLKAYRSGGFFFKSIFYLLHGWGYAMLHRSRFLLPKKSKRNGKNR